PKLAHSKYKLYRNGGHLFPRLWTEPPGLVIGAVAIVTAILLTRLVSSSPLFVAIEKDLRRQSGVVKIVLLFIRCGVECEFPAYGCWLMRKGHWLLASTRGDAFKSSSWLLTFCRLVVRPLMSACCLAVAASKFLRCWPTAAS